MRTNSPVSKGVRNAIIIGSACILIGILVYIFFEHIKHERVSIFGFEVLHRMCSTFGRIGFSSIYVLGGIVILFRAIKEYLGAKKGNN
jgi:hypothetical protein